MVGVESVDGLAALSARLKTLPHKVERKIARQATNKAATPVLKQARKDAPVGDGLRPDGTSRKHLNKNLLKKTKTYSKDGVISVYIGARWPDAAHGHLVEDGTKPHLIQGKLLVSRQGTIFGRTVNHPGAKGRHFMIKALYRNKLVVLSILTRALASGIEREAAKL